MIRILLIAPYPELVEYFTEIFQEHNVSGERAEYYTEKYQLSSIVAAGIEEINTTELDADVIITRGFIFTALCHLDYFIPVAELSVTSADLVHCLQRAREKYKCDHVALIGARNMVIGEEQLDLIFSMDIRQFILDSREEIPRAVNQAAASGIPVVIGGVSACAYARERGLGAVLLKSGREAIWRSITDVKRLGYIVRQEQERSQHLEVLVSQAHDGIITLDQRGRIRLLNKSASHILSLNARNVVGKPIWDALPMFPNITNVRDLQRSLNNSEAVHEVFRHADRNISATITSISLRGEPHGCLITLQEVARIQELETNIRKKIHSRGHVARNTFEDIIGESTAIKEAITTGKKYSRADSNVLIYGKTGTGKELFAQSIHNYSSRNSGPFVAVNCAALSESLLESELFGYVEGAFTGASRSGKPGLFELAHRGTLFLDEISEIPMRLQGHLLRAIQEKEIMRLGHDRVIPVDVRLITATNRSLEQQVASGLFREDLFYRIDILRLCLPDLAHRAEDIMALVEHWVGTYCQQLGIPPLVVSEKAKEMLQNFTWPGNIRQLRNVCERLVVLSESGVIDARNVEVFGETVALEGTSDPEAEAIEAVLRRVGQNRSKAARHLGISRTTLWRRMKQLKQS